MLHTLHEYHRKNQIQGGTEKVVWTPARAMSIGKHAWTQFVVLVHHSSTQQHRPQERSITTQPRISKNKRRALNLTFIRFFLLAVFNFYRYLSLR